MFATFTLVEFVIIAVSSQYRWVLLKATEGEGSGLFYTCGDIAEMVAPGDIIVANGYTGMERKKGRMKVHFRDDYTIMTAQKLREKHAKDDRWFRQYGS